MRHGVNRRGFLQSVTAGGIGARLGMKAAAFPAMKISRVRVYAPPYPNPLFNQSDLVVTVETDAGIVGIGEGGSPHLLRQCAGRLIGKDTRSIECLWQDMARAFFYPPGRERLRAIGALDLALWDIRGKALGVPLHQLFGGMVREFCECYNTGALIPGYLLGTGIQQEAQAAMKAGYKAFRIGTASAAPNAVYDTRERINRLREECTQASAGVGRDGLWMVDFHQRFDLAEALRACAVIEDLGPFFVEDPVRAEAFAEDLPKLRRLVRVPIAAGEEWGNRWDFNRIVEQHDLDYLRATLPNAGGITEMRKIAAICETHFVGLVPHFTGPVATAALVHCLGVFPGPVLIEYNRDQQGLPYLKKAADFRNGKLYPNDRPGLGVELELSPMRLVCEISEPGVDGGRTCFRTDGSITNW